MSGINITVEQRRAVVEAWRTSGQTQEGFCRNHPAVLSARTLRAWARESQRPEEGLERALVRLAEAVHQVMDLLAVIQHGGAPSVVRAAVTSPLEAPAGLCGPGQAVGTAADAEDRHQAVAAAGGDDQVPASATQQPELVQPLAFADPWTRGGGFLGPF